MKIDFSKELSDFTGEPLKMDNNPGTPNLTLKMLSLLAFKTPLPDDQNLSFKDKIAQVKIGIMINDGAGELTVEQAAMLKERIGKCFPAIIVAEAVERAIEGEPAPN